MSKLAVAMNDWVREHPWQHRALVTVLIVPTALWQLWNLSTAEWWLPALIGAVFAPLQLLIYGVLVAAWRRSDALEELSEHVLKQTDDKHLSDIAFLWAHAIYGLRMREVHEMNLWLDTHHLGSTPVDDLPPPIRRLNQTLILHRL